MPLTLRRILLVLVAAVTAWAWPTTVASAHTGTGRSVTSDFRTRITSVAPQVPGLRVRTLGLDGYIEATWTGSGTLQVLGYEGEPYLRLSADGIERNANSPATYLNGDRYARKPVPPTATAAATPRWERIGSGNSIMWHDHRTHYMSPGRPREVAAGADRPVVINPSWSLAVVADGTPVTVTGDLFWLPPPNTTGWLLASAGMAILLGLLLALRQWRWIAAGAAALASALLVVDSVGYLRAWPAKFSSTIWMVGWPAAAVVATVWMFVAARRSDGPPSPSIAVGGIILAAMGGYDRLDVIRHALVDSAMPDWFTRVTAVTCLAVGVALLVRFLVWLLPVALLPPPVPPLQPQPPEPLPS